MKTEVEREAQKQPDLPKYKISTYRVLISHRYSRSVEYRRLVRMLDVAQKRNWGWRWKNLSIPQDAPIMTAQEAHQGDVYERRIRDRMGSVHVVLYILRDEWLDEFGSIYLELVEGIRPRNRFPVPIVSVLPRGAEPKSLKYNPPGNVTVKWSARSVIEAIRNHAIPAFAHELRLTRDESRERARIVKALKMNAGNFMETAAALRMSESTLRRRRLKYIIR